MVSSVSPEEAGPARRREKRRMSGCPAATPESGATAPASQDHYSSKSCEEDFDGATITCGKWHPGESQRPEIDDAPIFTPTEQEFKDAIGYISSIRPRAEKYGICRIIPPSSWRPPCPLKEKSFWESTEFNTRVQQVDKLQNREPTKKRTQHQVQRKRKKKKRLRFGMTHRRPISSADSEDKFGFQSGSDFTLENFQKYADEFKQKYFGTKGSDEISLSEIKNHRRLWEPSVEEIEGEYWRILVGSSDEVEVDYGADLDTSTFGSGFAKLSSDANKQDPYGASCWNLNNLPRLPGSVISFENEDISGVLVPWLYVGMCFSSFCWHVEDHFLYSLNYMHFGEPKVWYGVPGGEAVKLEESMRKNLPKLFEEQPDLLHELVTQLSPSVLKSEGIPVYRAVQNPGEFVLTLPRAYHSGFNSGFNCAEAVNVAPVDWLPHGQCAVELYREQHRKTSISHDKLLLKTAKEAIKQLWLNLFNCKCGDGKYTWLKTCGKDGVLTSAVKTRVEMEGAAREVNSNLKSKKMDKDYDSTERECFSCFYDLHLSAVSCQCSPNRFACLNHTNILCSCEMDRKFAFFRYSMEELSTLVAALEGDWTAVCLWGQDHLGLVCPSSSVQKRKMHSDKNTEFSRKMFDVNVVSGYGGSQKNGIQNHCVDLKIEDLPSNSRIEEEHDKDRMFIDHGPLHEVSEMVNVSSGSDVASMSMSKCQVEPLDYGTVMIGKRWHNNQAIFPKGFRSRVTFYNVQDPTCRCFYVSEIIDAGPLGPLFKVTLEQVPNMSFTHTSPTHCWDSVRAMVNEEIINLHKVGKCGLPDLLPPDSVNGLEMFGFLSPQIIQEVESLDPDHQCLDYWLSKASCPVKELPSDSIKSTMVKCSNDSYVRLLGADITKETEQSGFCNNSCPDEVNVGYQKRLYCQKEWN